MVPKLFLSVFLSNKRESKIIAPYPIILVLDFHFNTAFQLEDNYEGFPVEHFCVCPRYANYVTNVLIPNGMIKDRSVCSLYG